MFRLELAKQLLCEFGNLDRVLLIKTVLASQFESGSHNLLAKVLGPDTTVRDLTQQTFAEVGRADMDPLDIEQPSQFEIGQQGRSGGLGLGKRDPELADDRVFTQLQKTVDELGQLLDGDDAELPGCQLLENLRAAKRASPPRAISSTLRLAGMCDGSVSSWRWISLSMMSRSLDCVARRDSRDSCSRREPRRKA